MSFCQLDSLFELKQLAYAFIDQIYRVGIFKQLSGVYRPFSSLSASEASNI